LYRRLGFNTWTIQSVASQNARSVWDCGLSRLAGGHVLPSVWTCGGFWLALGPGQDEPQARTVAHETTYQTSVMLYAIASESDNTHVTLQLQALSTNSYSYTLS